MFKKYTHALAAVIASAGFSFSAGAVAIGELGILDDTANGGTNPGTGAAWAPGDQYRLVFVTGTKTQATSTDITTYDAFVQGLADAANLGGSWQVLGSTALMDAKTHTSSDEAADPSDIPVILIDGTSVVANNYAMLWYANGDPISGINKDENGNEVNEIVFTGTDRFGFKFANVALGEPTVSKGYSNVPDWRLIGANNWGGSANSTPPGNGHLPNTQERAVYAMSEVLTIPGAGIPGDFDGDGDVDGVDIAEMFSNFNGPGGGVPTNPATDLDGDGDVDGVDIAQLFGAFTGPLAPATVPEPTSLALLGLSGLLAGRRR